MKPRNFVESANLAMEGILYVAKTQKHMRYHLWAAGMAIIVSLLFGVTRLEFLILSFIILLVLLAEMINTAVETIVDIISPDYHELAKAAKDVAAGAVFLVSVGAVITGYLILFPYIKYPFPAAIAYVRDASEHLTLISIILVVIAVILLKSYSSKGRPFYGGFPSGHAAVSFSISTATAFLTQNALISILTFILALMVASSRVTLGIHSMREIVIGAILGIVITVLLFQIFG